MQKFKLFFVSVFLVVLAASSFAQEHYTEGNVRAVSFYRTKPGQFDNYMKYLRANFIPQQEEAKKQGLIVDYYVLLNEPSDANDWDIAVGFVYKSFGDALDYNQGADDKWKEIQEKHFNTQNEDEIQGLTDKRFDMRTYLGIKYLREVTLKPM